MCEIRHEIFIKNLYNNEIIPNEILLINGVISKPCNQSEVIIVHSNNNENSQTVQKSILTKTGEFKILFQLTSGINRFQLNYCNCTNNIQCVFEENNTAYKIQPLYIICKNDNNEELQKSNNSQNVEESQIKITLALKLIQCLYAESLRKINKNNYRKTFTINSNCIPFYSDLHVNEARQLDDNSLWLKFGSEILQSNIYENNKNLKFVAFIGCTLYEGITDENYSYENIRKHTKATASIGGGGLALFGTGCLYTWPLEFDKIQSCFQNEQKIDMKHYLDDSNYRRTYSGCYTTTLGSLCHEIGHIFDLGHTKHGIMGNDFDYINHIFLINNDNINNKIKLTENLPDRIILTNDGNIIKNNDHSFDKRLTKIHNKMSNSFLQKYHQQKNANDLTYFTENCLIILNYHKWLNNNLNSDNSDSCNDNKITIDKETWSINSNKTDLKLIEIRTKQNGYVIKYFDLTQKNLLQFSILNNFKSNNINNILNEFSIFVITADGTTRLFE